MREKMETGNHSESNPKEVVVAWVNKTYANDIAHALRDKFLSALEENNKEEIKKLAETLENHLDYIRPKYRDTTADKEYIKQLEDGLAYLKKL